MSKQGKLLIFKLFLGLLVLILTNPILHTRITYNWSECGVEPGCDGGEKVSGTGADLGMYVVQSAGHFLNSYASWNTFLNRVEMSELNGLDYRELREVLYTAIEEMEKARFTYWALKTAAKKSGYVREVTDCLTAFDYDAFQRERGLNAAVFKNVKRILSRGDIHRVYKRAYRKTGAVLRQLYSIQAAVDADTFPEVQMLWRINQGYVEFALFGQYVSQVFYTVLQGR